MDTGRLLKVVNDIQGDEEDFGFQARFQNILNLYSQNNPDNLNQEKEKIREDLRQSNLANYVLSDYKVLDKLGIRGLFGEESIDSIEAILSSQVHEVTKKFNDFIQNRQTALTKLTQVDNSLSAFDLESHQLDDGIYEIGFSLPEEYQKVGVFEDILGDINQLLSEIASTIGKPEEFKISYVNNGSIEIYIQAGQTLAQHFDVLIDYALKIYGVAEMIKGMRSGYTKFSKKRRDAIEEQVSEEQKEMERELVGNMMKDLKIDMSEPNSRISIQFRKLLKHFEKGVAAEVRTPDIELPEAPNEDAPKEEKSQFKILQSQYHTKQHIDKLNKEIFKLQSKGFEGLDIKFLTDGENNDGKESPDNKK